MRLIIQAAAPLLAAASPPNSQGVEFGESGPLGLLLVILLAIAVVFLIRSMTKHLKKVPESFGEQTGSSEATDEVAADEDGAEERSDTADTERDEQKKRDESEQRA